MGYSERNPDTAVEPRLCKQWFLDMKFFAEIALKPVLEGKIKFHPEKYIASYRQWLENIQDWCISRQLWWGHRIPAYYLPTENPDEERYVVAMTAEEALEKARQIEGYENITAEELRHDEDALDTWFSSWLWPISLFDGIRHPHNPEIEYYYPTSDLVTAPDIIFFWVARMIMAGEAYMGDVPFRNVYFTGLVRDKLGRKMSKQLGNSPDPIGLIEKYGADAVRIGMLLCSSAGNDILFDESQIEQGRNFCNKIWNSYRLISGFAVSPDAKQSEAQKVAIRWFRARLSQVVAEVEDHFAKFRISDALMATYKLFWDDFCSWYLEAVKTPYENGQPQPMDPETRAATLDFFDQLLRMIHPIMPFITEELWQNLAPRKEGETIMYAPVPKAGDPDKAFTDAFELAVGAIMNVRGIRQQKNLPPREPLSLRIKGAFEPEMAAIVKKLANVSEVELVDKLGEGEGVGFLVGTTQMFVPLQGLVNAEEEIAKAEKDLAYQRQFLASVRAKLANEKFTAHAPEAIIANERKKEADALSRIESLEKQLKALKG